MKDKEIIRELINQSPNWSQNKIAYELGLSAQAMSSRMRAKNGVKVELFADMLDLLGYDVVVVPKGSRLPNGSIKVESDE